MTLQTLVEVHDDKVTTTSLKVADIFGREHKNVLRDISNLECSEEFNRLNFEPVEYLDAKGEKRPAYEMTKNGFVFLAMGFTGAKAAEFKETYINAFDAMEKALREGNQYDLFGNNGKQKHITVSAAELIFKTMDSLAHEKDPARRAMKHDTLTGICAQYGIKNEIARELPQPEINKDIALFWEAFNTLSLSREINHCRNPGCIAINIPYFYREAAESGYDLKAFKYLIHLLRTDPKQPLFAVNRCMRSVILNKAVRCAVFKVI